MTQRLGLSYKGRKRLRDVRPSAIDPEIAYQMHWMRMEGLWDQLNALMTPQPREPFAISR